MDKGIGDLIRHYKAIENLTGTAQDAKRLAEFCLILENTIDGLHRVVADKQSRILQAESEIARLQSRLDKSGVSM